MKYYTLQSSIQVGLVNTTPNHRTETNSLVSKFIKPKLNQFNKKTEPNQSKLTNLNWVFHNWVATYGFMDAICHICLLPTIKKNIIMYILFFAHNQLGYGLHLVSYFRANKIYSWLWLVISFPRIKGREMTQNLGVSVN